MSTFTVVAGTAAIFWGFTMLAIIDIVTKDFGSIKTKAIWGFIALIPFIGWLIYLIAGSRKGIRKKFDSPPDSKD